MKNNNLPMIIVTIVFIASIGLAGYFYVYKGVNNNDNSTSTTTDAIQTQEDIANTTEEPVSLVLHPFNPSEAQPENSSPQQSLSIDNSSDTWNQDTQYNSGESVIYNGKTYTAKWWTQGDIPGVGGDLDPWQPN